MNIIVRGPKGIGKSTIIDKALSALLARHRLLLGGILTFKSPDDGQIHITKASFPRNYSSSTVLGHPKTGVVPGVLETYAGHLLASCKESDLIILDELGFLEKDCAAFQDAVLECFNCGKTVIAVLKNQEIPWYSKILSGKDNRVFDVDENNRNAIAGDIINLIS